MSTATAHRGKTTAASTAGSFAEKPRSAPEAALGGDFVFDGDYRNLEQVQPFYESYLARRAELEAASKFPYDASFVGHIEGLSGPKTDTAIYLLQTLHRVNEDAEQADAFIADGGEEVDTTKPGTFRGTVARRGWYMGGTGWQVLGEGRLIIDELGRAAFIPKGKRREVRLSGTMYLKPAR